MIVAVFIITIIITIIAITIITIIMIITIITINSKLMLRLFYAYSMLILGLF